MIEVNDIGEEGRSGRSHIWEHCRIAFPIVCSFVMRKSVDVVSVIAVGHLGAHYLAAAGIASVTANVTGNSMIMGLSGALSTLCTQAYGARNFKEMNLALQRSLLILSVFVCIPVTILWVFSAEIMIALGQSVAIAVSASHYLWCMIPGLWALSASACIQQWLFAQSQTRPVALITLILALIHPMWIYLYIHVLEVGYLGAAIAISTTKILELISLVLYVNVFSSIAVDAESTWYMASFADWGPFLRLGIPSLLLMSEWWASEILIFMAGSLPSPPSPDVQVSAMSIYQNMLSLAFMMPAGFREAASVLVGNALGGGNAAAAQHSAVVAPSLAFGSSTCISIVLLSFSHLWGQIFTTDAAVVQLVSRLVPIMSLYVVADAVQTTLTGVMKGTGKQYVASPIVLFAYYVVGLPISAYLSGKLNWLFDGRGSGSGSRGPHMGVVGLCIGILVATATHMLCLAVAVYGFTDWGAEVDNAALRLSSLTSDPTEGISTRKIGTKGRRGADEDDTTGKGEYELVETSSFSTHGDDSMGRDQQNEMDEYSTA